MAQPPNGFIRDPNSADWWMNPDPAMDVNNIANWWRMPPDGFEYDPNNPGWAFRTGGDPQNQADWWQAVPDVPTGPVQAIDVASYQPTDLGPLIAATGSKHVVVRLYQWTVEGVNLRAHSKAQIASAQANGCSIGGYLWLYSTAPIGQQVDEALGLATDCGVTIPVLWLDIESYTDGSMPTAVQVAQAVEEAAKRGQRAGIYTGAGFWQRLGNPGGFETVPLWSANYDGKPSLDTPSYGGMRVYGHQYSDRGPNGENVDCDVFDPSVVS